MTNITPKAGQIWREVDTRFNRYIRVIKRVQEITFVETVENISGAWVRKNKGARGSMLPKRTAPRTDRFNGKRGGYEYVEG